MKLFKKETELDKLNAEVESTEFKKNSLLDSINGEKVDLMNKIKYLYEQIGETSYKNFCSNADTNTQDLQGFYDQINALNEEINTKNGKYAELEARYDEEINMLKSNIAIKESATAGGANSFCSNCGNSAKGEDMFCQKCGTKL